MKEIVKKQRELDWYQARLGRITGSDIATLMLGNSTKTRQDYIYRKAAERLLVRDVTETNEVFEYYSRVNSVTKAMAYGTALEDEARQALGQELGVHVRECGAYTVEELQDFFMDSPDGLTPFNDVVEIKCPLPATYVRAVHMFETGNDNNEVLKKFNKDYFYQCQAHMLATGATTCIFTVYEKMISPSLYFAIIDRDEAEIKILKDLIIKADAEITEIVKTFKQ